MKRFAVELRLVTFVTVMVDAESIEEAEEEALKEIDHDSDWGGLDADWSVESIEEVSQ
jgi:hypothetical protein